MQVTLKYKKDGVKKSKTWTCTETSKKKIAEWENEIGNKITKFIKKNGVEYLISTRKKGIKWQE